MDYSEYTSWLLKTALLYWGIFIVVAPLLLAGEFFYMHSKKKMTKKQHKDRQQLNNLGIGVLALIFIRTAMATFPIFADVIGEHYVCDRGEYTIEYGSQTRTGGATEWVVINTYDGDRIVLNYPRGKDLSTLPYETSYGTVWYSENSHYILEFIPDEPAEDG